VRIERKEREREREERERERQANLRKEYRLLSFWVIVYF
jgi:hypothetical protein